MDNRILLGDCRDALRGYPDNHFNLIVTSPPYLEQRKKNYGGVKEDEYVDWFTERSSEFFRTLRDDGSFILNIKEKAQDGERLTYVIELVLAMKKQGWKWTEEYIWHKKTCSPGKWTNRFRDAWEHCYHFTKNKKFAMYQDAVKVPVGDWASKRIGNLSEQDLTRHESGVKSRFGRKVANWVDRDLVYPTNVIHIASECNSRRHSAAFPEQLPEWFIKLFTKEGDVVLDPFVGSGTTAFVAHRMNRRYVGIDIIDENVNISIDRIAKLSLKTG